MTRILFLMVTVLTLTGCYDTGYQPHYIISHEEPESCPLEPEEEALLL